MDAAGRKFFSVSLDIEEPENAYRLRILRDDKEIFGVNRSPNAPQIEFEGVQHLSEQEVLVKVKVSDQDGDDCEVNLNYAKDQSGDGWYPLGTAIGTGLHEFRFDLNNSDLPASKTGVLIARACDGIKDGLNCTNAETPFTKVPNKPPRLFSYHKKIVNDSVNEQIIRRNYEAQLRKKFPDTYEEIIRKHIFVHYLYNISAYDVEDGDISDQVRWYDEEGTLVGKGESFAKKEEIKGLTAKVTDSHGHEVELQVED